MWLSIVPVTNENNQQPMWLSIVPVTNEKQPTVCVTGYCPCNQLETTKSLCDCLWPL